MTQLHNVMLAAAILAGSAHTPKFEDFPVQETFRQEPARPILRTRLQRLFRTQIKEAARKGPNFAGHYTIAEWGCGFICVSIVIIDAITGAVYDGPFAILGDGPPYQYEGGSKELEYKPESKLLIVRGCPEDEDKACATYYYEWLPPRWKLVRCTPAGPIPIPRPRGRPLQ